MRDEDPLTDNNPASLHTYVVISLCVVVPASAHLVYLLIDCLDHHQVSSLVNAVDGSLQLHAVTQLSGHGLTDLTGAAGKLAFLSFRTQTPDSTNVCHKCIVLKDMIDDQFIYYFKSEL